MAAALKRVQQAWHKLVCRWRGHVMYRIESDGSGLAALFPVDKCQRCGYWQSPPTTMLGIERSKYQWWKSQ